MKKITAPNYTQVPNEILDNIHSMPEAALRVILAVSRKTFGWHKERDRISLTQLQRFTGLSRQGVIGGTQWAMESGWLWRYPVGQSYEYELLITDYDQQPNELVKPVDQQLVKLVDTQKKQEKENTNGAKVTRPVDELFNAIAEVCQVDPHTAGPSVGKVAASLRTGDPPYTPEEVRAYGKWWWGWAPRKVPPTVWQLNERIGQIRAATVEKSRVPGFRLPDGV